MAALSLSPSPFASLLPSLPLPQLLQQSALPVLMCCWPTPVAARIEEAQQLMGATRVRAPGVLIPLRVFKLFSMIVGSMQVRSSSASRRSPCASPLLLPFSSDSVAHTRRVIADVRVRSCLVFASLPQELQGRSIKSILEYVVLAGSSLSPYKSRCARRMCARRSRVIGQWTQWTLDGPVREG